MAVLARLKDAEIEDGNVIYADDIDAELDQLVNGHNDHDSRLDDIESNATTLDGAKTFTSNIIVDGITERTSGAGVTADGVVLKDSTIKAVTSAQALTSEGQLTWDSATSTLVVYNGTSTETIQTDTAAYPAGYAVGVPQWLSTTTLRIPSGLKRRDDSNTVNITFSSNTTIDITTATGAAVVNGLMNGLTEANSTWYYLWAIAKANGADPAGILTTSASTIATYPTDYVYKRLLGAFRNDSSGNLLNCWFTGDPARPQVIWNTNFPAHSNFTSSNGTTNILAGGTATSSTAVTASSFVPTAIASKALIRMQNLDASGPDAMYLVDNVNSTTYSMATDGARYMDMSAWLTLDGSDQFNYYGSATPDLDIDVLSYQVTTEL